MTRIKDMLESYEITLLLAAPLLWIVMVRAVVEDLLKNHEGLRALKEKRRREEIESKLDESKPLEDILESLLKQSPTLASLFLKGKRLSTLFKTLKEYDLEPSLINRHSPLFESHQIMSAHRSDRIDSV